MRLGTSLVAQGVMGSERSNRINSSSCNPEVASVVDDAASVAHQSAAAELSPNSSQVVEGNANASLLKTTSALLESSTPSNASLMNKSTSLSMPNSAVVPASGNASNLVVTSSAPVNSTFPRSPAKAAPPVALQSRSSLNPVTSTAVKKPSVSSSNAASTSISNAPIVTKGAAPSVVRNQSTPVKKATPNPVRPSSAPVRNSTALFSKTGTPTGGKSSAPNAVKKAAPNFGRISAAVGYKPSSQAPVRAAAPNVVRSTISNAKPVAPIVTRPSASTNTKTVASPTVRSTVSAVVRSSVPNTNVPITSPSRSASTSVVAPTASAPVRNFASPAKCTAPNKSGSMAQTNSRPTTALTPVKSVLVSGVKAGVSKGIRSGSSNGVRPIVNNNVRTVVQNGVRKVPTNIVRPASSGVVRPGTQSLAKNVTSNLVRTVAPTTAKAAMPNAAKTNNSTQVRTTPANILRTTSSTTVQTSQTGCVKTSQPTGQRAFSTPPSKGTPIPHNRVVRAHPKPSASQVNGGVGTPAKASQYVRNADPPLRNIRSPAKPAISSYTRPAPAVPATTNVGMSVRPVQPNALRTGANGVEQHVGRAAGNLHVRKDTTAIARRTVQNVTRVSGQPGSKTVLSNVPRGTAPALSRQAATTSQRIVQPAVVRRVAQTTQVAPRVVHQNAVRSGVQTVRPSGAQAVRPGPLRNVHPVSQGGGGSALRTPSGQVAPVIRRITTPVKAGVVQSPAGPARTAIGRSPGQAPMVRRLTPSASKGAIAPHVVQRPAPVPMARLTPQKRHPTVSAEVLAAAAAAAAAVEPTPPLQPRSVGRTVTPVPPIVTARKVAPSPAPRRVPVAFVPAPTPVPAPVVRQKKGSGSTVQGKPKRQPAQVPPGMTFEDGEHVTIWNVEEKRKIAGNAAPLGKNIVKYLRAHPDCEVYVNQDEDRPGHRVSRKRPKTSGEHLAGEHVAIWNKVEKRKIAGNAAPLAKNVENYLRKNVNCEVYDCQDVKLRAERSKGVVLDTEPLDAWKDLGSYVDNEHISALYKTDYEQTAEFLLSTGNDDDDVSPLIMTGPLGVEEHVMIDLERFISLEEGEGEPLSELFEGGLPPLQGSLEIPNSS